MTVGMVVRRHTSAISRHHPPEFCKFVSPQKKEGTGDPQREGAVRSQEGRREDRVRAAPAVSCAKVDKKTHMSIQVQRKQSGLPCAMVLTAYFVLSPVRPELVCHRHPQKARASQEFNTCHRGVRTTRLRRTLAPRSS